MLFDSALRRDLARTFGATLVVLLTIVITMMLVRTLSLAASDVVEPKDVVLVLGYSTVGYLGILLSVALFVAIVVCFGRMYRDSEMAIWFASGMDLSRFVRPVLQTFWPVLLVVCLLQAFAWPWVNRNSAELRDRYAQRSDLARVSPGVFQSSADGRRVFFVERDGGDEVSVRNIFALSSKGATDTVVSARSGRLELEGDDRFIVLESGQRSDVDGRSGESTLAGFESYRALVDIKALRRAQQQPPKSMDTIDLVREPTVAQPGRAGVAHRPDADRGQPVPAGRGHVACQFAPAEQLEPGVGAAGLAGLLQCRQPDAGLGRQRALLDDADAAGAARRRLRAGAGAAVVARPCRGAALAHRCAARGSGMKTVRRMLYRDIGSSVVFVAVRLPGPVLFHRFRRRAAEAQPPRLHAVACRVQCQPSNCPATCTS